MHFDLYIQYIIVLIVVAFIWLWSSSSFLPVRNDFYRHFAHYISVFFFFHKILLLSVVFLSLVCYFIGIVCIFCSHTSFHKRYACFEDYHNYGSVCWLDVVISMIELIKVSLNHLQMIRFIYFFPLLLHIVFFSVFSRRSSHW